MTPRARVRAAPTAPPRPGTSRPGVVRALVWLALAAGAATAVAEVVNWRYARDGGVALTVRTGWALLRAAGFVLLAVDLPLCALLLGVDGLLRDGVPLAVAAVLAGYGLWAHRSERSADGGAAAVAD